MTSYLDFKWSVPFLHWQFAKPDNFNVYFYQFYWLSYPASETLSNAFWSTIQAILKFLFLLFQPRILLLVSLIDPCTLYFQGDILLAPLVVTSALPDVCVEIFLAIIAVRVLYMVVKHIMGRLFLTSLLSPDLGSKYVIPVVSQSGTLSGSSIVLKFFVICLWAVGNALSLLLLLLLHYHPFMHGICNYIPKTNHISKVHRVAAYKI